MNPDDPVCLCFHVTRRKVVNFIRIEKPRRPSQLSQCFGAGTGCGWCRPYVERLLAEQAGNLPKPKHEHLTGEATNSAAQPTQTSDPELDYEQYIEGRKRYIADGKGTPPRGADPTTEGDVL